MGESAREGRLGRGGSGGVLLESLGVFWWSWIFVRLVGEEDGWWMWQCSGSYYGFSGVAKIRIKGRDSDGFLYIFGRGSSRNSTLVPLVYGLLSYGLDEWYMSCSGISQPLG